MVTPFLHEATYQGMTYDLLPITDEREYQYTANIGGNDKVKTVLLNYEDTIWSKYSHVNIQNALSIYIYIYNFIIFSYIIYI